MSVFEAYAGGVHSFFSIWVFCLLQVVPFFLAFVIGASFWDHRGDSFGNRWKRDLVTALVTTAGFMSVFIPMGMPTTGFSKFIYHYIYLGNQFGGLLTGLIGLYLAGVLAFTISPRRMSALKLGFAFLFGMTLALAYKPCVTPTLTDIFNISRVEQTAYTGGLFLFAYTLGAFTAINTLAMLFIKMAELLSAFAPRSATVKLSGAVMVLFSAMIIGGYMTSYKSFLVGRFVPMDMMDDHAGADGHTHDMGDMDHGDTK